MHHLVLADGTAELLARAGIVEGHFVQRFHGADGFRAHRGDAGGDDLFDDGQRVAWFAERFGGDVR